MERPARPERGVRGEAPVYITLPSEIDILICQLRDSRAGTRSQAARALADTPSAYARKDLLRLLNDVEEDVRYWATVALSRLDDSRLAGRLAGQLEDASPQVRMVTAKVLAERPYRPASHALIRALGDDDENVGYWASEALCRLGTYPLPQLIAVLGDPSWKRRQQAAQTIVRIGKDVVPPLIKALERENPDVQYWVIEALGQLRAVDAAGALRPFLRSASRDVVTAAARALGSIGAREAVGDLVQLLSHEDRGIRQAALKVLVPFGDLAVKHLTELLVTSSRAVRLYTSLALAAAGDQALSPVLEQLSSDSTDLRFWVIRALERMGNPVVVPVLQELLQDEEVEIQLAAARALARYTLSAEEALILIEYLDSPNWRVRSAVADALAKQKQLPVSLFEAALTKGSDDTRYWLTRVLGHFDPEQVVDVLVARFEDPCWPVRKSAAESIARLGSRASSYLMGMLESERRDPNLRYWISRAMVGLKDPGLLNTLVTLLTDDDLAVRQNAHDALVSHGDDPTPQLLEALRISESRTEREAIARVLVAVPTRQYDLVARLYRFRDLEVNFWATFILSGLGKAALPTLMKLISERDERIRFQALSALSRIEADETKSAILECLEDEYVSVRRLAVRALGAVGAKEAIEPLLKMLTTAQGPVLQELLEALGKMDDPRAAKAVMGYLSHERWEVKKTALTAVGRLGGEEGVKRLVKMLEEEEGADLRPFLFEAIGRCRRPEVLPQLVGLLEGAEEVNLVPLLEALGTIGDPGPAALVLPYIEHASWNVRRAALGALASIGADIDHTRLKPLIEGEDPVLRNLAMQVLRRAVGDERWRKILEKRVKKSLDEPAESLHREALATFRAGDRTRAMTLIRRALRLRKKPEYYALLGVLQLEKRQLPLAITSLKTAIKRGDPDPMNVVRLGVAHYLQGQGKAALKLLDGLLAKPFVPEAVRAAAAATRESIHKKLPK